jgi:hypothetical protein
MNRQLTVVAQLGWAITVTVGLVLLGTGLWRTVYFEPTAAELARARTGRDLALAACTLLALAAIAAIPLLGHRTGPVIAAATVGLTALVCATLAMTTPNTVLPLLGALLLIPGSAITTVIALATARRR